MNTKQQKILFSLIFLVGMLVAITAGAKLPERQGGFPDTIPAFLIGSFVSLLGLILWRKVVKAELKEMALDDGGTEGNPVHYLKSVIPELDKLSKKIGDLGQEEICSEIDKILDNFVLPMAEVREKITTLYGMEKGANILVTVAYGERMLNRVWSAASDGHLIEAKKVFPDGVLAFKEASALL